MGTSRAPAERIRGAKPVRWAIRGHLSGDMVGGLAALPRASSRAWRFHLPRWPKACKRVRGPRGERRQVDGHGEHARLRTFFAGLGVGCHTDGAVFQGDAGISFRPPANGTVPDGYVDGWIERLKPAMGNLSALGLLDKTYVCASKVDPKHRDSKALAADPQGVACRWL